MRRLALVFPIISALVTVGIVSWEYNRRERLTRELRQTEREYARLYKQLPRGTAVVPDHDDHDHHDD